MYRTELLIMSYHYMIFYAGRIGVQKKMEVDNPPKTSHVRCPTSTAGAIQGAFFCDAPPLLPHSWKMQALRALELEVSLTYRNEYTPCRSQRCEHTHIHLMKTFFSSWRLQCGKWDWSWHFLFLSRLFFVQRVLWLLAILRFVILSYMYKQTHTLIVWVGTILCLYIGDCYLNKGTTKGWNFKGIKSVVPWDNLMALI